MYKTEIVKRVAKETRLSQRAVADVINATLETISGLLSHGHKVTLPGFGTFYGSERQESQVRSIHSGKIVTVPARKLAAFRVGDVLRRAMRVR